MNWFVKYLLCGCCSISLQDPMIEPINPPVNDDSASVSVIDENDENNYPITFSLNEYSPKGNLLSQKIFILINENKDEHAGCQNFFNMVDEYIDPSYKMDFIEEFIKKNQHSINPIKQKLCALVIKEYQRLAKLELLDSINATNY